MQSTDPGQLLRRYAVEGTIEAFNEVVRRYIDLVYSTALRRVNGDSHLARDVAQLVFIDLAAKAGSLPPDIMLGGWLHHHTCYRAATLVRGERRRREREQKAMEMNAINANDSPSRHEWEHRLDEALEQLPTRDHHAVVMRYFEGASLADVGRVLDISEDAAQKLVSRALERMRVRLRRPGLAIPAASAVAAACTGAVQAAPAGLAAVAAQAAVTAATTAGAAAFSGAAIKTLFLPLNLKVVVAVAAAFAATVLVVRDRHELSEMYSVAASRIAHLNPSDLSLRSKRSPLDQAEREPGTEAPDPLSDDVELRLGRLVRSWNGNSWSDAEYQASSHFLFTLRPGDIPRALAYIGRVKASTASVLLRNALIGKWAESDPRQAMAWVRSLPPGNFSYFAKGEVIYQLGLTDPSLAVQLGAPDPNIFQAWARRSPEKAAAGALQLPPGQTRTFALAAVATVWANKDPQGAVRWAGTIADAADRASALRGILPALAEVDPAQVAAYLTGVANQGSMVDVGSRFAAGWATNDPAAAIAWATSLPDGSEFRQAAVQSVVERWTTEDPKAVSNWLDSLPADSNRDKWVQLYVKQAAGDEPQMAAGWAQSLGDPDARNTALEYVGRIWLRADPGAAAQWLATSSLPDDQKKRLLSEMSPGK